jgi:hypothetical protein
MLDILIARARDNGQIGGLVPHLVDGGLSILQYADDTVFFTENNFAKVVNMKFILTFSSNYVLSKLTFIRARYFSLVRLTRLRMITETSLDVT